MNWIFLLNFWSIHGRTMDNCWIYTQIFAQIILTFRYGRDDEEVMGLKLSNESVLCVEQIYPRLQDAPIPIKTTKCQVSYFRIIWLVSRAGHAASIPLNIWYIFNYVKLCAGSSDATNGWRSTRRYFKTAPSCSSFGTPSTR